MTRDEHAVSVGSPVVKIITAWAAAFGVASWADAAAMIAFVYTLCLLLEWIWKRFGRPIAEHHGWIARCRRRRDDPQD
jgi:hypothetical protein